MIPEHVAPVPLASSALPVPSSIQHLLTTALHAGTISQAHAAGTMLAGRFEIRAVRHRSGMSTVYEAVDRQQGDAVVAVKQVSAGSLPAAEQSEARRWLAREAGLLSSLTQPHLPELVAAFSEGDDHYVVMPYLEGETLKELVERCGPLDHAKVLPWALALAETLNYMHCHAPPIIHRDLKPENILIQPNGEIMLLDLGTARPISRGLAATAIGTPGYAAPEQYQGLADEQSDLYGLGATLHYTLTGYDAEQEPPFRHPAVQSLSPNTSPDLDRLVASLLQISPDHRPGSAYAVQVYLEASLERLPRLLARPRIVKTAKRYAAGAVVFSLIAYVGAALWSPLILFAAGLCWIIGVQVPLAVRICRRQPVILALVPQASTDKKARTEVDNLLAKSTLCALGGPWVWSHLVSPFSEALLLPLVLVIPIVVMLLGLRAADRTISRPIPGLPPIPAFTCYSQTEAEA